MDGKLKQIGVALMLAVFVNFVFSNTVFLHSHHIGHDIVTHSHPYLPSSHHGHTQQALDLISAFNAAVNAFDAESDAFVTAPTSFSYSFNNAPVNATRQGAAVYLALRAPPSVN